VELATLGHLNHRRGCIVFGYEDSQREVES